MVLSIRPALHSTSTQVQSAAYSLSAWYVTYCRELQRSLRGSDLLPAAS